MATSNKVNEEKVNLALETICQQGCGKVWLIIDELEQGRPPEAALLLNHSELNRLLEELRLVMASYDRSGCKIEE